MPTMSLAEPYTMNISIVRTPRVLRLGRRKIRVEQLGASLPFARKPSSLREMCATGEYRIYITETVQMTVAEFDDFADDLSRSRAWLAGKGGNAADGRLCVEVHAPGRPYLYVDPAGCDDARYVARLG